MFLYKARGDNSHNYYFIPPRCKEIVFLSKFKLVTNPESQYTSFSFFSIQLTRSYPKKLLSIRSIYVICYTYGLYASDIIYDKNSTLRT